MENSPFCFPPSMMSRFNSWCQNDGALFTSIILEFAALAPPVSLCVAVNCQLQTHSCDSLRAQIIPPYPPLDGVLHSWRAHSDLAIHGLHQTRVLEGLSHLPGVLHLLRQSLQNVVLVHRRGCSVDERPHRLQPAHPQVHPTAWRMVPHMSGQHPKSTSQYTNRVFLMRSIITSSVCGNCCLDQ